MRLASLPLLALAAAPLTLGACKPEAPTKAPPSGLTPLTNSGGPGRPKGDFCKELEALPNCALLPEGAPKESFDPAAVCLDVGNQLFHCGFFAQSEEAFTAGLAARRDARVLHALGDARFLQEKWEPAAKSYEEAVGLEAGRRASWLRLAQARMKLADFPGARAAVAKARALDATKGDVDVIDADLLVAEQKYGPATELLLAAAPRFAPAQRGPVLRSGIQNSDLWSRRAERNADQEGQLLAAQTREKLLLALIEIEPGVAESWRELALARSAAGALQPASEAFQKAAELDAKDFSSPRMAAWLEWKLGRAESAGRLAERSLAIHEKQAFPHLVLAKVAVEAGDRARAGKEFDAALAVLDGKDVSEARLLAEVAVAIGQDQKAEALYATLLDDPQVATEVELFLEAARLGAKLKHTDLVKKACALVAKQTPSATCPPRGRAP